MCYEAARSQPHIFTAVVGAAVPYMPVAGDAFAPVAALVPLLPKLAYNVYFADDTSITVAELNLDVQRTLHGTLRQKSNPPLDDFLTYTNTLMGALKDLDAEISPIPFFTADGEGTSWSTSACRSLTTVRNLSVLEPPRRVGVRS